MASQISSGRIGGHGMFPRDVALQRLLAQNGWSDATHVTIAGDASDRRYVRLICADRTAILMDAPPGKGDDPADFWRMARHLRGIGLHAPDILAHDLANGFLLLEDLGDETFAKAMIRHPTQAGALYALACDALMLLQARNAPPDLPDLSAQDWAQAAMVALDWYRFAIAGDKIDSAALQSAVHDAIAQFADGPRVLILRDYHAENLMWLPAQTGLAKVGILDFQLGQMGQPGYDLVSLLQDARRDVEPGTEIAMLGRFCDATGTSLGAFHRSYAVLGIQRALRILGIFARLCLVSGKPGYLTYIPRVWDHLQRNLRAAGLADLTSLCDALLPAPDSRNLDRIASKCAQFLQP
jgi:N-acetylmuramate 1-kinase